jgi:hypothetical protein
MIGIRFLNIAHHVFENTNMTAVASKHTWIHFPHFRYETIHLCCHHGHLIWASTNSTLALQYIFAATCVSNTKRLTSGCSMQNNHFYLSIDVSNVGGTTNWSVWRESLLPRLLSQNHLVVTWHTTASETNGISRETEHHRFCYQLSSPEVFPQFLSSHALIKLALVQVQGFRLTQHCFEYLIQ